MRALVAYLPTWVDQLGGGLSSGMATMALPMVQRALTQLAEVLDDELTPEDVDRILVDQLWLVGQLRSDHAHPLELDRGTITYAVGDHGVVHEPSAWARQVAAQAGVT